jgi:DNA-binding CsgD family transcriptional regulator
MEDLYIALYDSRNRLKGYNVHRGGARSKASKFTRQKQSEMRKGSGNPAFRHDVSTERIIEWCLQGKSKSEIAKLESTSPSTVSKRLSPFGLKPIKKSSAMAGETNGRWRREVRTQDLVSLCERGLGRDEISEITGISSSTITKRFRLFGYVPRWKSKEYSGNKNPKYKHHVVSDEVMLLYVAGLDTKDLSIKFGVSPKTIKSRLKQAGVILRRGPRPKNGKSTTTKGSTISKASPLRDSLDL